MVFNSKRERFLFIVGVLIGLAICGPIFLINPTASPPSGQSTLIVENKIEYNAMYYNYVGEIGNASDGDVAVQIEFNLTRTIYNNIGVVLAGDEDKIHIYALCFYDNDKTTFYMELAPEINNWYYIEEIEDMLGLVVFYHREAGSVLDISTWIW